jgi:peptide/nickel transport system substrate-binding protein/oligopeptide transport system substrate-binding protein
MRMRFAFLLLLVTPLAFSAATDKSGPPLRELVVAYSPQKVNLDPLHTYTSMESQFYTAIYEGLVVPDAATLEPAPGVASNWDVSTDQKVYRFTLRPEAEYSNGDPVRAQDFVTSWMRMIDPAQNAEYSFLFDVIKGAKDFRTGKLKDASQVGIKALSDKQLEVDLEKPAPHFLKMLSHISFLPIDPVMLKDKDWNDGGTVIGNGPFTITTKTDQEILLDKNPHYWDVANLGLDRIRIRFIDDAGEATDGYITGKITWSTLIASDRLEATDRVEAFPMFGTTYFYFECDKAPWDDWRVRRGLALLVPWDQIRTSDYVFPAAQLIPAIDGYPEVKGIPDQQIDEGKKLLAEAGFPGGKGLPTLVAKVAKDSPTVAMVQKMADAWKTNVGLSVEIRQVDPDAYFAQTHVRDYTMGMSTWIGDYADPLTFLQLWTSDSNLNDARFSDKDYDAAVAEATYMTDSSKRYRRLADAEDILLTKAAILPLYHQAAVHLINLDHVDGWFPNPLDIHPFKFIKFKPFKAPQGIAMVLK